MVLFQLHHPGSKQQLEEVWEKQDHMENQQFDPKAFFFMHGLCVVVFVKRAFTSKTDCSKSYSLINFIVVPKLQTFADPK